MGDLLRPRQCSRCRSGTATNGSPAGQAVVLTAGASAGARARGRVRRWPAWAGRRLGVGGRGRGRRGGADGGSRSSSVASARPSPAAEPSARQRRASPIPWRRAACARCRLPATTESLRRVRPRGRRLRCGDRRNSSLVSWRAAARGRRPRHSARGRVSVERQRAASGTTFAPTDWSRASSSRAEWCRPCPAGRPRGCRSGGDLLGLQRSGGAGRRRPRFGGRRPATRYIPTEGRDAAETGAGRWASSAGCSATGR